MPYIKGGGGSAKVGNYVKYISTREGVKIVKFRPKNTSETAKQNELISQIIRDFPDTKNSHEFVDYTKNPTAENATEFIENSLEQNYFLLEKKENYVGYIANRPRVEKLQNHGLFSCGNDEINLKKVTEEIANHGGNVWTPIISLRREDAERVGYNNASAWKKLLEQEALQIADSLKIPHENFKWYAAFHDESHHPHVHMVCYSTDISKGFLTKDGIKNIKSKLTNHIFSQELIPLYNQKTARRDELKLEAKKLFEELKIKLQNGENSSPKLENLILNLYEKLQTAKGKKVYGYLQPNVKKIVDEIVDELAKNAEISKAYDLWQEIQNEINFGYKDEVLETVPLSKNSEFKSIKNMIIAEVLELDFAEITSNKDVENSIETSANMEENIYENSKKITNKNSSQINGCTLKLFASLCNLFEEKCLQDCTTSHQKIDSKLFKKLREKKFAHGQKIGDNYENIEQKF